jgi:hypothetical protein
MQEHSSSLDFFTEASKDLWKNLIPADEAAHWTKNFIWVLCTTDTPSDGFPNAPGINQYQISYAEFVRNGVVEIGLADVDTRGSSDGQSVDMMTKKALLDICRSEGIRPVSLYHHVDALRAVVKLYLGIDPTQQELAAKAQDEEQHQAKPKRKPATRPREEEAKQEENSEDEALRVLEAGEDEPQEPKKRRRESLRT